MGLAFKYFTEETIAHLFSYCVHGGGTKGRIGGGMEVGPVGVYLSTFDAKKSGGKLDGLIEVGERRPGSIQDTKKGRPPTLNSIPPPFKTMCFFFLFFPFLHTPLPRKKKIEEYLINPCSFFSPICSYCQNTWPLFLKDASSRLELLSIRSRILFYDRKYTV